MEKKSLAEYKIALKKRFDEVNGDDISGLLQSPSPGNLKRLCIIKAGIINNTDDREILKRFFDATDDNLIKKIELSDTDKLRPATNFLRGKTGDTQQLLAELIAILIDFSLRPYKRFSGISGIISKNDRTAHASSGQEKERADKPRTPVVDVPVDAEADTFIPDIPKNVEDVSKPKNTAVNPDLDRAGITPAPRNHRWKLYMAIGLVVAVLAGSLAVFQEEKDCLKWTVDHYELVDCEGNDSITGYRKELLHFRKLKVSDTTTFFKNGKAVVWYSKEGNVVAYFNADEPHPITGKRLRPITWWIIQHHVLQ